jgi:hypothetical protein
MDFEFFQYEDTQYLKKNVLEKSIIWTAIKGGFLSSTLDICCSAELSF